jgi:hypothetical protein
MKAFWCRVVDGHYGIDFKDSTVASDDPRLKATISIEQFLMFW